MPDKKPDKIKAAEASPLKADPRKELSERELEEAKVKLIRQHGKSQEEYASEIKATRVSNHRVWPPEPTDGEDDSPPPPPKTGA